MVRRALAYFIVHQNTVGLPVDWIESSDKTDDRKELQKKERNEIRLSIYNYARRCNELPRRDEGKSPGYSDSQLNIEI
jgi:hypothetical protein